MTSSVARARATRTGAAIARHPGPRRRLRAAVIAGLLGAIALAASGCGTLRGARLYREGTAALERGDATAAVAALERAARLVPRASEVQNHLGLAYGAADRPDAARRAFERALALDCDNDAARRNLRSLLATEALPDGR